MKPHKTMSNHFFTCAAVAALSLSVSAAADAMGDGNGNSQGSSAVITTEIDFNDNCSVTVTSTKELSNIVIESTDGSVRFDDLSGHQYTISGEDLLNAVNVYVKSGNNGTRGKRNRGLGEPLDTDEFRASEIANDDIDQNCNGFDLTTFFADEDADGFGNPNNTMNFDVEPAPPGFVSNDNDCDDMNADINPSGTDSNGVDGNCDGTVDEVVFALAYSDINGNGEFDPGSQELIWRWVDEGNWTAGPGDKLEFGTQPVSFEDPTARLDIAPGTAIIESVRSFNCIANAARDCELQLVYTAEDTTRANLEAQTQVTPGGGFSVIDYAATSVTDTGNLVDVIIFMLLNSFPGAGNQAILVEEAETSRTIIDARREADEEIDTTLLTLEINAP